MCVGFRSDTICQSLQNIVAYAFEPLGDEISLVETNHSLEGDNWSGWIELCLIFFIFSIEFESWLDILLSGLLLHFWFLLCELTDDVLPHQRLLLLFLQVEFFDEFKLLL